MAIWMKVSPHQLLFCGTFLLLLICAGGCAEERTYYPASDNEGGWRKLDDPATILDTLGFDVAPLDEAFEIAKSSTKNGGLLVVRDEWLIYEKYFGLGHREALTNLASVGKSFTSVAAGILMEEQAERFPHSLDQKVFHHDYLPAVAFPPADPEMHEFKLGQLLAFSAGIRGN